jgi:hypothetical protein
MTYSVYEVSILTEGKPRKAVGNWAGVMNTIYDALGESAMRCVAMLGEAQAEMFFGQDVNVAIVDSKNQYRINIKTMKPREKSLEEWIDECVNESGT